MSFVIGAASCDNVTPGSLHCHEQIIFQICAKLKGLGHAILGNSLLLNFVNYEFQMSNCQSKSQNHGHTTNKDDFPAV